MFVLSNPSQCRTVCADADLSFAAAVFCSEFQFYLCPILRILITISLILVQLHLILILNLALFSENRCSFGIGQSFSGFLIVYLRQESSSEEYYLSMDAQKVLKLKVYQIDF